MQLYLCQRGQKTAYEENITNKIVEVPEELYGITKTRNYIINYFENEDILFLDDDVKECGYFKVKG